MWDGNALGGGISFGPGDVACTWVYWPTGFPDFNFTPPLVNEDGCTLVRTQLRYNVVQQTGPDRPTGFFSIGITPYENADATALDRIIVGPGIVPDPYYNGNDWLIKVSIPIPSSPADYTGFFQSLDGEFQSRAMRKLPSGTGLLMSASWNTDNANSEFFSFGITANFLVKLP